MWRVTIIMRAIVITTEKIFADEYIYIKAMLDYGIDNIHIRKPFEDINNIRLLLDCIDKEYHNRLTLNGNFQLLEIYKNIKAIHANSRNHNIPKSFNGSVSYSCHSLKKIIEKKEKFDYMFLSPIYDSISKTGYRTNFSYDELKTAKEEGIIDNKIFALGGVTPEKIPELKELGFGGVAFMGYIWNSRNINEVIDKVKLIKSYM